MLASLTRDLGSYCLQMRRVTVFLSPYWIPFDFHSASLGQTKSTKVPFDCVWTDNLLEKGVGVDSLSF